MKVQNRENKLSNDGIIKNVKEQNYHVLGHQRSGEASGMPDAFNKSLDIVYQQARNEILNSDIQGIRKEEAEKKLSDCNAEKAILDISIQQQNGKLDKEFKNKNQLETDLMTLNTKPESILGNDIKGNSIHKIYYRIFLALTLLVSIYIFFFYNSAGYSAFFKNWTADDTNIAQAIFDSHALSKTFIEGIGGVFFLLFFPFILIAAGLSIHPLFNTKAKVKKNIILKVFAFVLIIISFIYDVIIAYKITKAIDDIRIEGLVGAERARAVRMTLERAMQDVNFWSIIFAGFVAYIILSGVFYLCMDFKHKLNILENAKKSKQEEIDKCIDSCTTIQTEIDRLEQKKVELENLIKYYTGLIAGVIVKISDILPAINGFYTGWISYIKNSDLPDAYLEECKSLHNNYLQQMNANAGTTSIRH